MEHEITRKNVKGIVTRSDLPSTDYVVNPYTGCTHSCSYCYARFMKRFSDNENKWGEFVEVKENALDVFQERDYRGKNVLFSSVTDPYQPVEADEKLTRKLLKKFKDTGAELEVLTKSYLAMRDKDIFQELNNITVGTSLSTLDSEISHYLEPGASPPEKRLEMIEELNKEGVETFLFVSPIIPEITDFKEILEKAEEMGYADYYMFEDLNLNNTTWPNLREALKEIEQVNQKSYRQRYEKNKSYWEELENSIVDFCRDRGLEHRIYFKNI